MFFKHLVCGAQPFLMVQENIHRHRIVVNAKMKFESKGILVFLLPSLIPFTEDKSEWGKTKRSYFTNLWISEQYQKFTTYRDKSSYAHKMLRSSCWIMSYFIEFVIITNKKKYSLISI